MKMAMPTADNNILGTVAVNNVYATDVFAGLPTPLWQEVVTDLDVLSIARLCNTAHGMRAIVNSLNPIEITKINEAAVSKADHLELYKTDEGLVKVAPTDTARRMVLAQSADTSPDLLNHLAKDPNIDIRIAVAGNDATPVDTLLELVDSVQ